MIEFQVNEAARQKFSTVIERRRVTIRIQFNHVANRWFFDLALDGDYVLFGRKVVRNVNLIEPFNFGIGVIFAFSPQDFEAERDNLANGLVKIYQVDQGELDATLA